MTTLDPNTDYPIPDNTHLLSEIGYASLPPPLPDHLSPSEDASTSPWQERFAPQWSDLLRRAVEEPGLISEAYTRFHGYSLGNRFAALVQCQDRGLEPGPISTFNGWRKLGYGIQKGQHALCLCMPLKGTLAREKSPSPEAAAKRSDPLPAHRAPDIEEIEYIRAFVWKPHWFVLSQTQPLDPDNVQPLPAPALNGWDKAQALSTLNIKEAAFSHLDGNVQGYASGREVAVSPLSTFPLKTLFHEMAHVVLGHTDRDGSGTGKGIGSHEPLIDTLSLSRSQIEVEAEGVALLLLDTFDLPGQEYARGYIQHWLEGEAIPEKSAQRIFGGADRILSAGLNEGRVRFPTAEDLAWPGTDNGATNEAPVNGTPANTLPSNGTPTNGTAPAREADREPTPQRATIAAPASNGSQGRTTPRSRPGERPRPALPALDVPGHAAPANDRRATADRGIETAPLAEALAVPDGAAHAWKLHERLIVLHGELHPEDRDERRSLQRAVRYLERLDPEAAAQVRELVSHASLSLKTAFARLESVLDDPLDGAGDVFEDGEEQDPGEESGAALERQPSPTEADIAAESEASAATNAAPGSLFPPEASPLLPARTAAARRVVGHDLRQELRTEKNRFFAAARAHGLKTGGTHEKAMLKALSGLLGVPVNSRRDLSSRQWSQGASAIETEDLRW